MALFYLTIAYSIFLKIIREEPLTEQEKQWKYSTETVRTIQVKLKSVPIKNGYFEFYKHPFPICAFSKNNFSVKINYKSKNQMYGDYLSCKVLVNEYFYNSNPRTELCRSGETDQESFNIS